jgi:hypothetical protein
LNLKICPKTFCPIAFCPKTFCPKTFCPKALCPKQIHKIVPRLDVLVRNEEVVSAGHVLHDVALDLVVLQDRHAAVDLNEFSNLVIFSFISPTL